MGVISCDKISWQTFSFEGNKISVVITSAVQKLFFGGS